MEATLWKEAKQILADAMELPPADRPVFVQHRCAGQSALEGEIRELLNSLGIGGDLLSTSGMEDQIALVIEPGAEFDGYRVERAIGRGGSGVVYLATDPAGAPVAIKVLTADAQNRRFELEKRILASLDHPMIAKLLDSGTTPGGRPYLVTRFIDGPPIHTYCEVNRLELKDRVELLRRAAEAVDHAHRQGVIHRDLKPSNILVAGDGTPALLDFGISKLVEPAQGGLTALTRFGARPMTPEYASPEQLEQQPITQSTDIYSLGLVMVQVLTGQPPQEIRRAGPLGTSRIGPLPLALAGIARRALEPDPLLRYASVGEMISDFDRYQRGLTPRRQPARPLRRAKKLAGRHRLAVGMTICAGVVTVGIAVAEVQLARTKEQKLTANFETSQRLLRLSATLGGASSRDPRTTGALQEVYDFLMKASSEAKLDPQARIQYARAFLDLSALKPGVELTELSAYQAQLLVRDLDSVEARTVLARTYFHLGEGMLLDKRLSDAKEAFFEVEARLEHAQTEEGRHYHDRAASWTDLIQKDHVVPPGKDSELRKMIAQWKSYREQTGDRTYGGAKSQSAQQALFEIKQLLNSTVAHP